MIQMYFQTSRTSAMHLFVRLPPPMKFAISIGLDLPVPSRAADKWALSNLTFLTGNYPFTFIAPATNGATQEAVEFAINLVLEAAEKQNRIPRWVHES